MKLLTINSHSLIECNYLNKCEAFADTISKVYPDIIAMQEVNQSIDAKQIQTPSSFICVPQSLPIKSDNHALTISKALKNRSKDYFCAYTSVKKSYDKYDEGLCIFSTIPIEKAWSVNLSKTHDYTNWKRRKALIAEIGNVVVACVHMGWWDDYEEPFIYQWNMLKNEIEKYNHKQVYIMGDFNCPAHQKQGGYKAVIDSGWHDTYIMAQEKDEGYTAKGKIDGWEKDSCSQMRIDYIFSNLKLSPKSSFVIFNSENGEQISDHNGVIVTI